MENGWNPISHGKVELKMASELKQSQLVLNEVILIQIYNVL